jgi:hypothetical protein
MNESDRLDRSGYPLVSCFDLHVATETTEVSVHERIMGGGGGGGGGGEKGKDLNYANSRGIWCTENYIPSINYIWTDEGL